MTSTHKAEAVRIHMEKHDNADSLSVVSLFDGGYTCVVRTDDWKEGQLAVYIVPDTLVDTNRPEFSFLKKDANFDGKTRVRAKKLRGIQSFGLLIPAPEGVNEGDDLWASLGLERYEAPEVREPNMRNGGQTAKAPPHLGSLSKYDVDSLQRYHKVFVEGEPVLITEKLHGQNMRINIKDGETFVGSRNFWKMDDPASLFWRSYRKNEATIRPFLERFPNFVLWGESYGNVPKYKYGLKPGEVDFAAFDIYDLSAGKFVDAIDFLAYAREYNLPTVPIIRENHPYSFEEIMGVAEGQSLMPGATNIREGVVVKPIRERWEKRCGRVQLKCVSAKFLEKDGA